MKDTSIISTAMHFSALSRDESDVEIIRQPPDKPVTIMGQGDAQHNPSMAGTEMRLVCEELGNSTPKVESIATGE